jgi:hypothetical protein
MKGIQFAKIAVLLLLACVDIGCSRCSPQQSGTNIFDDVRSGRLKGSISADGSVVNVSGGNIYGCVPVC